MTDKTISDRKTVDDEHNQIGIQEATEASRFMPTQHPDAQWFADAGLGMFLHWGICSVRGMNISWPMIPGRPLAKVRIEDSAERERIVREQDYQLDGSKPVITPLQYWEMAKSFDPQNYDPDRWCAAFKQAGFTYVVLTTKHHDGFAMWPSKYGDYNTSHWAGGVDLVGPFVEACRRHDLKVGLYFSGPDWYHDQDFRNFFYYRVPWENPEFPTLGPDLLPRELPKRSPEEIQQREQRYRDYVTAQIEELLTEYGKIDVVWFDGSPAITRGQDTMPAERIRELQPGIVINPRLHGGGDYKTYERTFPEEALPAPWNEFCDPWTGIWTYSMGEQYRATAWVIGSLAKCRAKRMNYLLGIGPNKDGELVPAAYTHLAELAEWMGPHRASVLDGVQPLPAGEQASVPATASGDTRYLFVLRQFADDGRTEESMLPLVDRVVTLSGVSSPRAVALMRDGQALPWTYANGCLTVEVSAERCRDLGDVIRVNL